MPANRHPPRRLLVVANPISGGGKSRRLVPALCAALERRGIRAEARFTEAAGDAAKLARAAGGEDWDGIVAAGGDGTMNEVLRGMPDLARPVGFLPVGTANVLAAEFGLPRAPEPVAAMLAAGHLRELAIGACDERRFLLFVGAGLDGAVVERLAKVRRGTLGKHRWLGPILHTVRRWPHYHLRATLADGTVLDDLSSVLVTRVRNYGGVVRLTPDIDAGDGLLHVLAFRARRRISWAWMGARAFVGRLRPGRRLTTHATTAVRIEGNAPFQIDGDFGGRTPISLGLGEKPALLFVPHAQADSPPGT